MKKLLKTLKERFSSKVTWIGIASIFVGIVTSAGYELKDLTTWGTLGKMFIEIVTNPYILISIGVTTFSILNNPTNKKGF